VKLGSPDKEILKAALKPSSRGELKALFGLVRRYDDKTLLAALAASKPKKRQGDPLIRELERTLRPIMGPSAEKAELLIAFMAKTHRRKRAGDARGIAEAARRLRLQYSDAQIRAGAQALLAHLKALYGEQETVV
jgi:hypothetical protein